MFTGSGTTTLNVDTASVNTVNFTGSGNWTMGGTGALNVASGMNFGASGSGPTVTISAPIAGNAALNLNGGSVTLSNASIAYAGGTTVNAGTLNVTGTITALGGNVVTVNGSTLTGSGTINSAVVLTGGTLSGTLTIGAGQSNMGSAASGGMFASTGGTLAPGGAGTAGTITLGSSLSMYLGDNTTLNFDLATPSSGSDLIQMTNGTGVNLMIGGGTININGLTGFGAGTYPLIKGYATWDSWVYAGSSAAVACSWANYTFNSTGLAAGYSYHLANDGSAAPYRLDLIVDATSRWNVASGNWSASGSWSGGAPNSAQAARARRTSRSRRAGR